MKGLHVALTGVPRSGTTLACQMLGSAPDTVALFEPMDVLSLDATDPAKALDQVLAFFDEARASLAGGGSAPSQQIAGHVPDNPMSDRRGAGGLRVREAVLGRVEASKPLGDDFTLVVKHNAAFTALLPGLARRIPVYACVRNPLAVLASWHSVDLPVSAGRIPAGERLDPGLAAALDAEPGVLDRQIVVLNWFFARFGTTLDRQRVVRYEELVASDGRALSEATGIAVPSRPLSGRNASANYDRETCERLAGGLLADHGAWRDFYTERDVHALLDTILARR